MTARVRVVIDPERAWSVPSTAAQDDADGSYVWKVDAETMTVSKQYVELADDMVEDRIRLKSGVQEGDLVAISGVLNLREGTKVKRFESPADR